MTMVNVEKLIGFYKNNNKVALALSGGTDSAYLMYAAIQAGADVSAYYANSQFQPEFERDDARRLAEELGCRLVEIEVNVLSDDAIVYNQENRCYLCKRMMFEAIVKAASADGYDVIIDGTNASDIADDRPGMRAIRELGVLSPLRMCGITKSEVRELSKAAGLWTWDKPSYACLATRIKTGERITADALNLIDKNEEIIRNLGYKDFRIRVNGNTARLELRGEDLNRGLSDNDKETIRIELKKTYGKVLLDGEEN